MKHLLRLCEKLNNHIAILRKLGKVDKESEKKKGGNLMNRRIAVMERPAKKEEQIVWQKQVIREELLKEPTLTKKSK